MEGDAESFVVFDQSSELLGTLANEMTSVQTIPCEGVNGIAPCGGFAAVVADRYSRVRRHPPFG